jgi:hypothetical protein
MTSIYVVKRLIDYVGLQARNVPEGTIPVETTMQPVLALLQAMGADGAKVVGVDPNGNLLVSLAGSSATGPVNVAQIGGTNAAILVTSGDTQGEPGLIVFKSYPSLYNGVNWDRQRTASAANQVAATGLGVAEVAPPGNIAAFSAPALGAQATASRAAGAAGVRHICTGYEIVVSCQAAPGAGQLLVNLRDGASGAGAILKTWAFEIPAAIFAPFIIAVSGKSIVGSAATAMTLESSAAYAAVGVSVAFDSYDAS